MLDLRRLKTVSLSGIGGAAVIPEAAWEVRSPLRGKLHVWKETLLQHPNRELAEYVLEGIEKGFRIGFNHRAIITYCRQLVGTCRQLAGTLT